MQLSILETALLCIAAIAVAVAIYAGRSSLRSYKDQTFRRDE